MLLIDRIETHLQQGGVVASPDTDVPGGGSYYYHWMRDGGLSMRTVCGLCVRICVYVLL